MLNNKLDAGNESYLFSTTMPVRITDVSYGKHLGQAQLSGFLHNARLLFLNHNGFDELNIEGLGIIMTYSSYEFKSEAFFNDQLIVNIAMGEYSKLKFNLLYEVVNQGSGKKVVSAKEEFAFFDYQNRKVRRMPEKFLEFCQTTQANLPS